MTASSVCEEPGCKTRNYSATSSFCRLHRYSTNKEERFDDPQMPFGWTGQNGIVVASYEPCYPRARCLVHAVCVPGDN
jgi:hypothetical protein